MAAALTVGAVGLREPDGMAADFPGVVVVLAGVSGVDSPVEVADSAEEAAVDRGKEFPVFAFPPWDLDFISPIFALL